MANPVVYPFRSAGEITEKSEVYSLGMVLLEASSETTVATSTHGWLGFLLFRFVNFSFAKQKNTLPNLQQTYAKIIAENVITN